MSAAFAESVDHFVVGEHCAQGGAPVDQGLTSVGEAEVLQQRFALCRIHRGPFGCGARWFAVARGIQAFGAPRSQVRHKRFDRLRARNRLVVPGSKQLNKNPLRPAVVVGVAGLYLAAPVKTKSEAVQLLAVALDVGFGGDGRVLSGLNGVLFCRKAEGVKTHRVQHVKALVALKAADDVAGDVAQWVSHVQAGARRIGKHVKHIKRLPIRRKIRAVHI